MYEITTNLSLYKKDKKFIFPTKVVISKKCANCKNKYLNFCNKYKIVLNLSSDTNHFND